MVASLGNVSNETLQSAVRINTLTLRSGSTRAGVGSIANSGEVTAPQIGTFTIAHDASVNMQVGSVTTMTIRGTLSNSTIYLTTPLTP